jgi:hypothetical protein
LDLYTFDVGMVDVTVSQQSAQRQAHAGGWNGILASLSKAVR